MGQSYLVEARFIFKNNDPSSFCKVFKKEVMDRDGVSADFNLKSEITDDPFDCFNILTGGEAYTGYDTDGNARPDIWCSAFDGSYGWEIVMYEIFSELLKQCENGSRVRIWPDSGETEISVKDGVVTIK